MRENKTLLATLAALSTQIIFGFSFMFTKIALRYASPMTVIANRYMIAFLGLTLAAVLMRCKIKIDKNIWKPILMSVFQPVLYFVCETYGIQLTTTAFSSVIIALTPVVCIFPAMFVLREMPTPLQCIFTVVSIVGVAILSYAGKTGGVITTAGVLYLCGAVVSGTIYIIMSRKLSDTYSAFERTYVMTVVGLVFFVALALIEQRHTPLEIFAPFVNAPYVFSMLYLGVLSSVLAFLFLNYANTYLTVAKTTVFLSVNMVVSVSAGVLLLKEPFTLIMLPASIMVLVGVCGVQVCGGKNAKIRQ